MLALDITVVTVALPRIQHDLSFSRPGLAWVVNGYVLMAGGLLLLGGRLADLFGRRRLFGIGVLVFGLASAASGAAVSSSMLVTSRFVQGTGEALAGPAALGMIPVLFPDSRERMKALGVWGGLAGLGGTLGSVISGALTGLASWRWIFYINLPVVLFALLMVPRVLSESRMVRAGHRIDVPGALTATGGLVAIVYGLLQAASHPWDSWPVLLPLLGGVGLLLIAVVVEARAPEPLIPLRFFTNRTRVTSNVLSLALLAAFIGYVFLLTLYQQQVLGYSPYAGDQIRHGVPPAVAQTHGYALSFRIGAAVLAVAGVLALVLLEHVTATLRTPVAEVPSGPQPAALSVMNSGLTDRN